MDQVKIGKFIADLRKEKGLTQRELAETMGVSDKTISKWECGNGMPEMSMIMPLCRVLGINVNELLSGEYLSNDSYSRLVYGLLGKLILLPIQSRVEMTALSIGHQSR